jgi:hypothetical protein
MSAIPLVLGLAGCASPPAPAATPSPTIAVATAVDAHQPAANTTEHDGSLPDVASPPSVRASSGGEAQHQPSPVETAPTRPPALVAIAPAQSPCVPADWSPRKLPPLLRPVPIKSVDVDDVVSHAERTTIWERPVVTTDLCGDNPSPVLDMSAQNRRGARANVEVQVLDVRDAGKSGRGWPGSQCTYGVRSADGSGSPVTLGPAQVPPFNELTAIERAGSRAYVAVQFNGYAREAPGGSNRLVAVDLCDGQVKWTSQNLVANTAIMLIGDYLVSPYGFTAEPDFVYVHNAYTGERLQKLPTPSAGEQMWLKGDVLVVKTYDGFVAFKVAGR